MLGTYCERAVLTVTARFILLIEAPVFLQQRRFLHFILD